MAEAFFLPDLTNPMVQEMIGKPLVDALLAAQTRLGDASVMARCAEGLWVVERGEATVVGGLTYEGAVAAVEALAP